MAEYRVRVKPSAAKELERLPDEIATRIEAKLVSLGRRPRPVGVRKLKGESALWRIRIGDWRVVYSIDDDTHVVDIIYIRHRSKAYE